MRMRRTMMAGTAVVVALTFAAYMLGAQPPRDAVAAAEAELGIDLESRMVDVGDVTLHVVLAGPPDGEPVVLLHGFPEFWYAWRKVMAPLAAAGFRVIAPDQRGYNRSDKPGWVEAYRVEALAADVAGLIDALGYRQVNLVGHDWGGGVAWKVAIDHPQRLRRLAVIDTPHPQAGDGFESAEDTVDWYRTFMQAPWIPEFSARLGNYWLLASNLRGTAADGTFPEPVLDVFRSAWDQPGARSATVNWYRAAYRFPQTYQAEQRIALPTLLILAPDDVFIASDLRRRSARFLDQGRTVELERGTHWVIQEEPAVIAGLLAEFFAPAPAAAR